MKYIYLIAILVLSLAFGCNNNKSGNVSIDDILNETAEQTELEISEESINEVIQSIPSPLEIATLIKESGAEFDQDIMNSTNNRDSYVTEYDKALAMGIYSGDLGYINIYGKAHIALNYLQTVKKLADNLNVGQFFDFETIKEMAANSDKLDSLLYLSTMNFERMDQYMRNQKRSNLSVLMVTGTWMESLFIATKIATSTQSEAIIERIAEQKMILDQILLIVSAYEATPYFADLKANVELLKEAFSGVTIDYIYREPETIEKDGRLIIVDNSETVVHITPEQVEKINEVLTEVRNNITKNV